MNPELTSQVDFKDEIKCEFIEGVGNQTITHQCPDCPDKFYSLVEFKTHRKEHSIAKRTCQICKMVCRNFDVYESHINRHLGLKPYKCDECNKQYHSKHCLKSHSRYHLEEKSYHCSVCSKGFVSESTMKVHENVHNPPAPAKDLKICKIEDINCSLCCKTFANERIFTSHLKTHTELQYPCEHCNRIYESLHKLKKHLGRVHIPNTCTECNETFLDRAQFTKHRKEHEPASSNQCDICSKVFTKRKNLIEHVRLQHTVDKSRVHKCDICGNEFINKSLLRNHVKSHVKLFKCKYCDRTFCSAHNLREHIVTHTGERNFACDICGKSYSRKAMLKNHMGTQHSSQKNFRCDRCEKTFHTNHRLYVHKLSHETEEKFECNVCHAKFRVKQYMKSHMKTHSNIKPFQCVVCRKQFKHKKSWIKHMKRGKHKDRDEEMISVSESS